MIYYESEGNRYVKLFPADIRLAKASINKRVAINDILRSHGFNIDAPYNERVEGVDHVYEQPK